MLAGPQSSTLLLVLSVEEVGGQGSAATMLRWNLIALSTPSVRLTLSPHLEPLCRCRSVDQHTAKPQSPSALFAWSPTMLLCCRCRCRWRALTPFHISRFPFQPPLACPLHGPRLRSKQYPTQRRPLLGRQLGHPQAKDFESRLRPPHCTAPMHQFVMPSLGDPRCRTLCT